MQTYHNNAATGRTADKARAVKWFFFTTLVLINASFTLSFFFSYYSQAISFTPNAVINKWLAGLAGIVLLDIAALAWLYLYENLSLTARARNVAQSMAWVSLSVSTIASVAQLTLSNQLVSIPADIATGASWASLLTIAGILAAHSVAMMQWLQATPEAQMKDASMTARAAEVDQKIEADKTLRTSVSELTQQKINAAIPILARIQARQLLNSFVTAHGTLPMLEDGTVDRQAIASLFPELAHSSQSFPQLTSPSIQPTHYLMLDGEISGWYYEFEMADELAQQLLDAGQVETAEVYTADGQVLSSYEIEDEDEFIPHSIPSNSFQINGHGQSE